MFTEIDEFVAPPQEIYKFLLIVRIPMLFHECTEGNFFVIFALEFGYALQELGHDHTSQNQRIDRDAPANLNASKGSSVTGTGLCKVANRDANIKGKNLNYCVNNTVWYGPVNIR